MIAGGQVEFEAPRTDVINESTARPMPVLILLKDLIVPELVKGKETNKKRSGDNQVLAFLINSLEA